MGIKYFLQVHKRMVVLAAIALVVGVAAITMSTLSVTNAASCAETVLKKGSRGSCVSDLQKRLNNAGYNAGPVDGVFGPKTRAGVISYQKAKNLQVDGVAGPETWGSLTSGSSKKSSSKSAPSSSSNATLKMGSKGEAVRDLQQRLARAGFAVGRAGADGSYGTGTKSAVVRFQKQYGLKADGVAGSATIAKLKSNPSAPGAVTKHLSSVKSRSGVNIVADKSQKTVYVFKNGELQRAISARFGGEGYDKNGFYRRNTPTGSYRVYTKIKDGYSNRYDAKMPYFTVFNGDIGFHYSSEFAAIGYGTNGKRGSHGCVNIGNMNDAKYIYDQARSGSTRVVVQN